MILHQQISSNNCSRPHNKLVYWVIHAQQNDFYRSQVIKNTSPFQSFFIFFFFFQLKKHSIWKQMNHFIFIIKLVKRDSLIEIKGHSETLDIDLCVGHILWTGGYDLTQSIWNPSRKCLKMDWMWYDAMNNQWSGFYFNAQ